jgi:hypothetical protein
VQERRDIGDEDMVLYGEVRRRHGQRGCRGTYRNVIG